MNKDINQLIVKSLEDTNLDEIVREAARDEIIKTVKQKVKEMFRGYSEFGSAIEKLVADQLSIDVGSIKLPEYREFLIDTVNTELAKFVTTDHAKDIQRYINEKVVGEGREEIPFRKFWVEFVDSVKSEIEEEDREGITIECSREDKSYGVYWNVKVLKEEEGGTYSHSKNVELLTVCMNKDGVVYHSRCKGYQCSRTHTWAKALEFKKTKILEVQDEEESLGPEY